MSLCYTILELLGDKRYVWTDCFGVPKLRAFFTVYGCLAKDAFAPTIDFVWADGKNDGMNGNDGSSMLYVENENFVFWSGSSTMLDAPPTELKLKILESLAAIDIAKMKRERGELSIGKSSLLHIGRTRRSGRGNVNAWQDYQEAPPVFFTIRCDPHPFRFPSFIGGDYDHRPVLGIPPPNDRPGLSNFARSCNAGASGRDIGSGTRSIILSTTIPHLVKEMLSISKWNS
ncbi:F-BOX PROTEIN SKIP22 [Salix purpurea]|uniref:F-BOX PROTEIN SKIP22 n=1 Tax=Salix purpurea TaxID=77065 RepID=A0A9Q1A729_SALPP|nr:F-BOX PROTEIN SKIP22 [Salix purpurea]